YVRFVVKTGGGTLAIDSALTDASGQASVAWTLGTTAGPQQIEASSAKLPSIKVNLDASSAAAPPSPATSVVTLSTTSLTSGANTTATLHAKDQYGNSLTTGGATVVFSLAGGTSTATVGSTTDNGDGTYSATLTGLVAGSASTVHATLNGTPVT